MADPLPKEFRVIPYKSILGPGEFALEEVTIGSPNTLALLTAAELQDLFWVLARHLSRTVDDCDKGAGHDA